MPSVKEREARYLAAEQGLLEAAVDPISPADVISRLKADHFDDYSIRAAILIMMDDGRIERLPDGNLVVRA